MSSIMKKTWIFFIAIVLTISCKDEAFVEKTATKLKNPYDLSIMKKAADALHFTQPKANFAYVSMRLSSDEQADYLLKNNIFLSQESFLAESEAFPDKKNAYFFAVVPKGFDMKDIPILKSIDLYIPSENESILERKAWEYCGYTALQSQQIFTGRITCKDPIDGIEKGIKGVQVRYRQFAKIWTAVTNERGEYTIQANLLTNKPEVLLTFENELYEVRNFDADNIIQLLAPYTRTLGNITINGTTEIIIGKGNQTNATLQTAATTFLAIQQYRTFSEKNGYNLPPKKMNVWISGDDVFGTEGSFAAPMLRNLGFTDINSIKQLLVGLFHLPLSLAGTIANSVKSHLPDIYAPYYASYEQGVSKYYIEAMFHEFSHAGHYSKVGNSFWKPYITHIYENGGYGNGEQMNSGLVALSESWAEDLSMQCLRYFYGNTLYSDELLDINTNANYPWIPWGLYNDIYDKGNRESWDAVENISFEEMYGLLTLETNHPEVFKTKLKNYLNADVEVAENIDVLFEHYGF